jgi:hypothetical protein
VGLVLSAEECKLLQRAAAAARLTSSAAGARSCGYCRGAAGQQHGQLAGGGAGALLGRLCCRKLRRRIPPLMPACPSQPCLSQGLSSSLSAVLSPAQQQVWLPDRAALQQAGLVSCASIPAGIQSALLQAVPGGGVLLVLAERPRCEYGRGCLYSSGRVSGQGFWACARSHRLLSIVCCCCAAVAVAAAGRCRTRTGRGWQ